MPDLKFIADMNISPLTVERLKIERWDILRVSEIMDVRSGDTEILDYARNQDRTVITQDLDFSEILAIKGLSKPSLISLRLENAKPDFVSQRIIGISRFF